MDYTQCAPSNSDVSNANFSTCAQYVACKSNCRGTHDDLVCSAFLNASKLNASSSCQLDLPVCQCQVNITSSLPFRSPVHVYYAINNYYQNHRRYLNSLDLQQLHGDFLKSPTEECRPIIRQNGTNLPILPCGLIANSWFNGECVFYNIRPVLVHVDSVPCCCYILYAINFMAVFKSML